MWIFITEDLRNYFFYRTISAMTSAEVKETTTINTQELQPLYYQQQKYAR